MAKASIPIRAIFGGMIAAPLVLAGCSFAPEYLRPAPPVASQWPAAGEFAGRPVAELPWQDFFPDSRLQALIGAALAHNRDLRIAVARVEEARGLYGIARADRIPATTLSLGRDASLTPAGASATGRELKVDRYDFNLNLLSFELDFWGRVKNLSDAALASYLATEEAGRAFRLSLIADVADAYLSLAELQERSALARETLGNRQESLRLVTLRRDAGVAGDLDVLQARGSVETARAELASLERQRAAAGNALTLLVGQTPEGLPPGRSLSHQGIVPDLAADLPAEVLLRRPDVRSAEQKLMAANANIGAARAAFLPRISLTAALGSASGALADLFASGTRSWSFSPVLQQPLFGGISVANLDVAEARKVLAVAEYEKAIQQAFREVADLLAAREALREQLLAQEAAEKAQNERLRIVEIRYKGGVASHLELLDAQREAFAAQQNAVLVRRLQLSNAAQLYKALGGGDKPAAGPAPA
ncbi:MAG: efflux transporter outer membrane subunit [Rhodocyclaceae bacterium]|nr:efflux transporter outer membrane subunit [Rhodocyclaceae bacterium]